MKRWVATAFITVLWLVPAAAEVEGASAQQTVLQVLREFEQVIDKQPEADQQRAIAQWKHELETAISLDHGSRWRDDAEFLLFKLRLSEYETDPRRGLADLQRIINQYPAFDIEPQCSANPLLRQFNKPDHDDKDALYRELIISYVLLHDSEHAIATCKQAATQFPNDLWFTDMAAHLREKMQ